jgi:quinol monooxygenase YgiN
MVIEYIRYDVPPGRSEAFAGAYRDAGKLLDADPHCLAYEVARGVEEPEHWVVRIEWDSLDGHLLGFRRSPAFGAFFAAVRPFFGDIREMKHYEAV